MSEQQTTARLVTVIVALSLSIAAITFIGVPAVILLAAVAAWLVYQQRRGRYVRLPGRAKSWYRWLLSGVATLAVGSLPLILSLERDWVWGLGGLLTVVGLLAVVAGVAMGLRDLRQHRSRVTPA